MQTIKAQSCFTGRGGVASVQAHLRASPDPRAVHLTMEMFLLFHPLCVCVCVCLSEVAYIQTRAIKKCGHTQGKLSQSNDILSRVFTHVA